MSHRLSISSLLVAIALTGAAVGQAGPDVIVGDLTGPGNYGTNGLYSAYSIGTTSCNIGSVPLAWISNSPQHPVIGQNLYRLRAGRFECVGISWLKHGFTALQQTLCGACNANPNGNALGVGCSDPYSASLNGQQSQLGPRYEVNPSTGVFPYPFGAGMPVATTNVDRRLRVLTSDVTPNLNPGARYFAEGQYIHPDDAAAGNDNNNASYREILTSAVAGGVNLGPWVSSTVRMQPAIYAWQAADPQVSISTVDVPGDGRFIIAWKASPAPVGGFAHYEFAVFNLNSDRAAGSVAVSTACGATIANAGFKSVPHHSGEPYNSTAWVSGTAQNGVTWATAQTFAQNPNANALRWGTLYNFWFDSNMPPQSVTIGLFKTGTPASVSVNLGGGTPLPEYQVNSFSASLDVNNVQTTGAAPAVFTGPVNTAHTFNFFSFNTGQYWDLAYTTANLIPRSACALTSGQGQVVNLDLTSPTFGTWFGGTFQTGFPFSNFNFPLAFSFPTTVSIQMAVVAPNLADGIALSQATRVQIQ